MSSGLEDFSLFDLFRMEAEEQVRILQTEIIQLESGTATATTLESLMRAAHSVKGAARIVGLDAIVHLTHAMEDRFVAAQAGRTMTSSDIDRMLGATDWLAQLQNVPEAETAAWFEANQAAIAAFTATFQEPSDPPPAAISTPAAAPPPPTPAAQTEPAAPQQEKPSPTPNEDIFAPQSATDNKTRERTVRISADRFDQILSLASEMLVASRNLAATSEELERDHRLLRRGLEEFGDAHLSPTQVAALDEIDRKIADLAAHIADLDLICRANERSAERIYRTTLAGRLRPFSDGITAASRLVRDTSRGLGKSVRLEILGERTRVDRDILDRLEAPLSHLISNAIDHGIESPSDRVAAGKPAEATLKLHARHENGRLVITVRDDGRGIDPVHLRERIIRRNLVTAETAAGLSDHELLEFLFLPGFSTREEVSQISGRGVGLNVVQSMVQEAGGSVTVSSNPGAGTVFRLTLPVTRSVIKVIRVQVEGELYAVPLVRIDRVANLELSSPDDDATPTVDVDGQAIPVVALGVLLGLSNRPISAGTASLLFCKGIAFTVDRLIDEVELSVRQLDARLGKVPGVSAASLDENGFPLLILDMEDLAQTALGHPAASISGHGGTLAPHVLIVDDSHTVREMERRVLVRAGYNVTTAQNGQEAWNLLRLNEYELLISDVDMPQMNGIELVTKVRENPRLGRMPVIILSYKDREQDRRRGFEAGADFYLTKGDFNNDALLRAVVDLIGTAEAPG